jgi:hypothetical protein
MKDLGQIEDLSGDFVGVCGGLGLFAHGGFLLG